MANHGANRAAKHRVNFNLCECLEISVRSRKLSFGSFEISQQKRITDQAHYGHILDDTKCWTQVQSDQRIRQLIRLEKMLCSEWQKSSHFSTNTGIS
ncbi:MAG: hypothetical protein EZS28_009021 [Streblomastix strix]|uniref:Uncharacterized protein n=1 Tax=Streblomastix strix TaxID=222440 RepID=A0A5J4WKI3_9EUKA|nr:MAG: hypothetical protein EZS28_009021 [Streblomastix strix]